MTKLHRILAALGIALATSAYAVDMPELKIGLDPTFEPFEYKLPDGTLTGFEVDLAKVICTEVKMKCVFVEQAWGGIIPSLMAKKFDVIFSSMSVTDERKKVVLFSDKYSVAMNRMAAKRGSSIDGSVASLVGKRIGVGKASTQEAYARKHYEKAGATVVAYPSTQESYLDLEAGRLDAVIANVLELKKGLLEKPEGKNFQYVGPTALEDEAVFGIGSGIALRKDDTALRDKLNAAIKAVRVNGEYKKVNDKYFDFDTSGN